MNERQRDQHFRREVAIKIAEIEDKHCKPCMHNSSRRNKSTTHCRNCEFGKELVRYGELLTSKSKRRKESTKEQVSVKKKEAKQMSTSRNTDHDLVVNGLSRDKYMMLKDERKPDSELMKAYKLTSAKLTSTKEKWGLLGYRGNVKAGSIKKKVKAPENLVPMSKHDHAAITSTKSNDSLIDDYEKLKSEHEKLLDHNVGAAEEFLKLNNELEKSKETIFDLQNQISHKDHHIDALQDQVNELERLESIEEKYLATVTALKVHLPEVGEMK
ncbi:zinc-finger domain-containing protein [Alkalihalophilus lindianensis]|uniref:Zinc-finger domain-containing protein n=1 Tax=Alkalihalophilus lindianensis TaxID=1630542 RepID=A0ABU3X7F8_9BACI|nr:zinc-finger domain-containing protein [Alkalihalophilus lindianensis]MDV2683761.1 zinc-finger domain-containing protein [Alkalihalophilus lindianensis]MDV2683827.1 zinc-finger domain-containing protein [Alkalihalophilus lindianensis]